MGCGCKGKVYNINMGCCTPVIAPADQYYTKGQIDEMIENIEVSACCITAEEVDEKIEEAISGITPCDLSDYYTKEESDAKYLTEHQPIKTINNISLIGEGNIEIGSGGSVDLSDYVRFEDLDEYMTYSEIIQYITNLQNQIDSLKQQVSGCCSSTGDVQTRWITMTGEYDYVCSGSTKYTKEKEQTSTDGYNWTDTGNYRMGNTVLEENSSDCTYCARLTAYTSNGDIITPNYHEQVEGRLTWQSTMQGNMYNNREAITSVTVSSCVNEIGEYANNYLFGGYTVLSNVMLPSSITRIHPNALICNSITSITCLATTPPFMSNGYNYFYTGGSLKIYVPSASVEAYKAADGWSQYADIIQPIQ